MKNQFVPSENTIASKLAAESRRVRETEPDIARAYDNLVDRLVKAGASKNAPRNGDLLPPFALPDEDGRLVQSTDFAERRSVVVSLNRGHWCSYCRIELESSLQNIYDEVQQRGGAIVAITLTDRRMRRSPSAESANATPGACSRD